jgi:hypothetical protein
VTQNRPTFELTIRDTGDPLAVRTGHERDAVRLAGPAGHVALVGPVGVDERGGGCEFVRDEIMRDEIIRDELVRDEFMRDEIVRDELGPITQRWRSAGGDELVRRSRPVG